MSYSQAMKWRRKHPKGTRQPIIMSTGSGFWPAFSWMRDSYWPYCEACKSLGVEPIEAKQLYDHETATCFPRSPSDYAAMTAAGNL